MEEENKVVEPVVEPNESAPNETTIEKKALDRNEMLRDLSKEYGVNLFDAEGLEKFKQFTESQKTELEKAQEVITAFEAEKNTWESKQLEYESKLKASELGIKQEVLEDALKLAGNDPNNLAEVIKKYPMFVNNKGIKIGIQNPNNNNAPSGLTEAELYMAQNPRLYKK